jgi:hypothetical protein
VLLGDAGNFTYKKSRRGDASITALRATSSKREPGEQSSSTHSVTMSDSFVPRASICPSGG